MPAVTVIGVVLAAWAVVGGEGAVAGATPPWAVWQRAEGDPMTRQLVHGLGPLSGVGLALLTRFERMLARGGLVFIVDAYGVCRTWIVESRERGSRLAHRRGVDGGHELLYDLSWDPEGGILRLTGPQELADFWHGLGTARCTATYAVRADAAGLHVGDVIWHFDAASCQAASGPLGGFPVRCR
jgi:hypothetical protein